MDTTALSVVRSSFGTGKYSKVIAGIQSGKVTDRQIEEFLEAWEQWAARWTPVRPTGRRIQPFAYAHWRGDPTSGLSTLWKNQVDAGESEFHRQLLRHLLYCDAIAVPDPVMGQGSLLPMLGYRSELSSPAWTRELVAQGLAKLSSYAELIDSGVLVIVPGGVRGEVPTDLVAELAEVAKSHEADFPRMPESWLEINYAQRAAIDLGSQMVAGEGVFDVYLPTPAHERLFITLLNSVDREHRRVTGRQREERLLWRLLQCDLPDVGDLPIKDVISIRRADEFRFWRDAVAQGLERLDREAIEFERVDDFTPQAIAEAVENVEEAARVARGSVTWSGRAVVGFTVQLVTIAGGVAGAALFPAAAPVFAGLGVLPLIHQVVSQWQARRPGALGRHVALFRSVR
jgi:hypothetical protein